jgi:hypothetical protein
MWCTDCVWSLLVAQVVSELLLTNSTQLQLVCYRATSAGVLPCLCAFALGSDCLCAGGRKLHFAWVWGRGMSSNLSVLHSAEAKSEYFRTCCPWALANMHYHPHGCTKRYGSISQCPRCIALLLARCSQAVRHRCCLAWVVSQVPTHSWHCSLLNTPKLLSWPG